MEEHRTAGGRWASGEGGGRTPRMRSRICKALYPRSGIFPTWRPNGFARPGEPEGSVFGKGEGLPYAQRLPPEELSAPSNSHGAAQTPDLPTSRLPGLLSGSALSAPGLDTCHLRSRRAFVLSGQAGVSQKGITSLGKGEVGS